MKIKISPRDICNFNEDEENNLKRAVDIVGKELSFSSQREAYDKGFILVYDERGFLRLEVPHASEELDKELNLIFRDLILVECN